MIRKPGIPANITAAVKNDSVTVSWRAVSGADGYKLFFYEASDPSVCIKTRYSEKSCKTVSGFELGKEYYVKIRAFVFDNNAEHLGDASPVAAFTPVICSLKAEGALSLKVGDTVQIRYEYDRPPSLLSFVSTNSHIAEVSSDGKVRALKNGECYIKITSPDKQSTTTKIIVGRTQRSDEKHAVLMFTGDITCSAGVCGGKQDYFKAFDCIRHILSDKDYLVGVFNAICSDRIPFEYEQRRLSNCSVIPNVPKSFVSAIADAGFDAVVTASDNSLSNGLDGMKDTVKAIKASGLDNIGTLGDNPVITSIKGIKVGFAAVNLIAQASDDTSVFNHSAKYDREYFLELLNSVKAQGAEFIVVLAHWGAGDSHQIRKSQLEEARFMAESGADLIVGAHTHTVQYFGMITTKDGRSVPCAYSLGNFLSVEGEMTDHRDGAILRVELSRRMGKISAECTAVPCYSENGDAGVYASAAVPSRSLDTEKSASRTLKYMGKKIKPYKPSVAIIGSSVLNRILTAGDGFRVDKTAMYLSPLSLGAKEYPDIPNDIDETLKLDIGKDLKNALGSCDYAAVDFYTAATVSCFRDSDELFEEPYYFSNSKRLRGSDFYSKNRPKWLRIRPPFGETLWKPLVKRFAERLLSVFPSEKLVLFRTKITSNRFYGNMLRTVPENTRQSRLIREMEDYFISLADPAVVDLSDKFFVEEGTLVSFENEYYSLAYAAFCGILSGSGRNYVDNIPAECWFSHAMKFYESMTTLSLQDRLLDMSNAPDKLMAYTNAEFCARHSERLIRLKKSGRSDLMYLKDFFADEAEAEELIKAAEIIQFVEKGNLTKPYDFYAPAFDHRYNIVRSIARLLSKEIGGPVNERNAEMVFLLRGQPQSKRYFSDLYGYAVDIWGSDVSRLCAERCKDVFINESVTMQPQLLYKEKPVFKRDEFNSEDFGEDRKLMKLARSALTRDGIGCCENSPAPWIIVDFADIISKVIEYKGNLFELNSAICATDFYKKIRSQCSEGYVFEKRNMKFCSEGVTGFSKDILELYGENIILIKSQPAKSYISRDYRLEKLTDELLEIKRKFISLCEERFASVTGCYVIDISKNFYSSEDYPYGGKGITNYEDEFYLQTSEYISQIIRGTEKRLFNEIDENYILLRTLKLKRDQ